MLKPLADRIVVKEVESKEETTGSGIILDAGSKTSRHREGVVVSVGRGRIAEPTSIDVAGMAANHFAFYPMETKVGDTVVYTFGDEFTISGEKLTVLREQDVLAIIEK